MCPNWPPDKHSSRISILKRFFICRQQELAPCFWIINKQMRFMCSLSFFCLYYFFKGRSDAAVWKQTDNYIQPLYERIRKNLCPDDIMKHLSMIVRLCIQGNYIKVIYLVKPFKRRLNGLFRESFSAWLSHVKHRKPKFRLKLSVQFRYKR